MLTKASSPDGVSTESGIIVAIVFPDSTALHPGY